MSIAIFQQLVLTLVIGMGILGISTLSYILRVKLRSRKYHG